MVAILAALGVLLLWRALDGPADTSAGGGGGGSGTEQTTTTSVDPSATTAPTVPPSTTVAPVEPATVRVVVANAAGVNGAAGAMTDTLKGLNYVTLDPTTATVRDRATTAVYYVTPESAAAAAQVAADIGGDPAAVAAVPADVPVQAAAFADAMVLVLLGKDLAPTG